MVDILDSSAVRHRLSKEAFDVVQTAEDLGWVLEWASQKQQAIALRSRFDDRKLLVPLNSINANRLRSLRTQIIRHTDPEVIRNTADLTRIADRNRNAGKIPATFDLVSGIRVSRPRDTAPREEEPVTKNRTALGQAMQEAIAAEAALHPTSEAVIAETKVMFPSETVEPERVVVSETPWMVRKGGHEGSHGRMYESHSVIHRVWSDGSEDYRCRFCEYDNENPRGVAGHASRTKNGHPAAGEIELHTVNEYVPSEIKRPLSGVRRLTTELTMALDGIPNWDAMDQEELARVLAEHVYAMRPDPVPAQPLTPEQIIRRITLMVEGGRLAEMHQQVEATAAALREAQETVEAKATYAAELEHQVATLRDERRALAAMLTEGES